VVITKKIDFCPKFFISQEKTGLRCHVPLWVLSVYDSPTVRGVSYIIHALTMKEDSGVYFRS